MAFPSIATGAFGYPVASAAQVALETVRTVLESGSTLALVRFVLFSDAVLATYQAVLDSL